MKVLIIDDHPIVISGCRALLGNRGIDLIDARTAKAGLEAFDACSPDVAVIDINLPDESGLDLARRLLARDRTTAIVILSMNDDPIFVRESIAIGARGFVSKNDDPAQLAAAIEAVGRGDTFLPEAMAQRLADSQGEPLLLSSREQEVVRLLSEGSSLAEIAATLEISYKTVTQSCTSARGKLGARTPAELVRRAFELKLV
jgi:DNA-binding NarL/FixJ family response regulator